MQRTCEVCTATFYIKSSRVAEGKGRFCSLACYKQWREQSKKNPFAFVRHNTKTGCWEWTGGKDKRGYGMTWDGKKWRKSHRVFYEWLVGPISPGLFICHRCDNPSCINPEHLFPGTQKDNIQDAIAKKRFKFPQRQPGESNPMALLTNEQVRYVRSAHDGHRATTGRLARELGVSVSVVHNAVTRRTYRNVV